MKYLIFPALLFFHVAGYAQQTYCNPIDIDYTYVSHHAHKGVGYRAGADPAVINFNDEYYMFVTRSFGYWHSTDLLNWTFIEPVDWFFSASNAPGAYAFGDKIIALGDPSAIGSVIETDNPKVGDWKTNYAVLPMSVWDPALFVDDDNKVYLYEESSNKNPIRGVELDPDNMFLPKTEQVDFFTLDPEKHGWERFGQNHTSDLTPYMEGAWMTKHNDTYYLQYAAPGTQWNVYADGVYTSDKPLGPFTYAPYNPVSYKPRGFLSGAGHGSTVRTNSGDYWHFATMLISVNYKYERRIGMFPAGFEDDGQMYVNNAYGDYPHYGPDTTVEDHKNRFTGWMLLSKGKKVKTNSVLQEKIHKTVDVSDENKQQLEEDDYSIQNIADENIRTFWTAENNSDSIYFEMDLGSEMQVNAIQINFMDFNSKIFGRKEGLTQQFVIEVSNDGITWKTLIDRSEATDDRPNFYHELESPIKSRYIKFRNVSFHNQYLSIAEFRVFGKGGGKAPKTPKDFVVERQTDLRNANVSWRSEKNAMGYVLYWGISPDRLNNSVMIYQGNSYEIRALNVDQNYFYAVESFNENGISKKTNILSD